MATLKEVCDIMEEYNAEVAYGSECTEWQVFCADSVFIFGIPPYDEKAEDREVPYEFFLYWKSIGERDYETAKEYGDIEWLSEEDRSDEEKEYVY